MHVKVACLIFLLHVFINLETRLSSNSVFDIVNTKSDNKMQIGMFKKRQGGGLSMYFLRRLNLGNILSHQSLENNDQRVEKHCCCTLVLSQLQEVEKHSSPHHQYYDNERQNADKHLCCITVTINMRAQHSSFRNSIVCKMQVVLQLPMSVCPRPLR